MRQTNVSISLARLYDQIGARRLASATERHIDDEAYPG